MIRTVVERYQHTPACCSQALIVEVRSLILHGNAHYVPSEPPRCTNLLGAELYFVDRHIEER